MGILGEEEELITAEITVNKPDEKQFLWRKILGKATLLSDWSELGQ